MALLDDVREILVAQLAIKPDMVKPEAKLEEDFGADSLDAIELVSALEEKFGVDITDDEGRAAKTVGDVISLLEAKLQSKPTETG